MAGVNNNNAIENHRTIASSNSLGRENVKTTQCRASAVNIIVSTSSPLVQWSEVDRKYHRGYRFVKMLVSVNCHEGSDEIVHFLILDK